MLTNQEKRSLASVRRKMNDILLRCQCISNDHPEYDALQDKAYDLLAEVAEVQEQDLPYSY